MSRKKAAKKCPALTPVVETPTPCPYKVGDIVQQNAEWFNANYYKNGRFDHSLRNLGNGKRFEVLKPYAEEEDDRGGVSHIRKGVKVGWFKQVGTTYQWTEIVPVEQLEPYPVIDQDIEEKYTNTVKKVTPMIEECLRMADAAISDAIRLSEANGIPFHGTSGISQVYTPSASSFPKLPLEIVQEITGITLDEDCIRHGSWEHSAFC